MKLLVAANLALGSNTLPSMFCRKMADTAMLRKYDRVVLINLFAPTTDHWKALTGGDYKSSLDEFSSLWRVAGPVNLTLVLGEYDQFIQWKRFSRVRDGLVNRGVTILNDPTNEADGVILAAGHAKCFAPPPTPPAWLTGALRIIWPPLDDRDRLGCQREAIAEYAVWSERNKLPITIHGLPGPTTWGRVSNAWVGCPGKPPEALVVDTTWPDKSEIVRF